VVSFKFNAKKKRYFEKLVSGLIKYDFDISL